MTCTGTLLARADTRLAACRQDEADILARRGLTRMLLERYPDYHRLRLHLFHPAQHPTLRLGGDPLAEQLRDRGWLVPDGVDRWAPGTLTPGDDRYLRGGWLEELLWLAHREAGCDELHLGAGLEWRVGEVTGHNEVDVLARRGPTLSFTSCKSVRPLDRALPEALRGHLLEVDYWNEHFAGGQGRAILAVTADIYDEHRGNRWRYPPVHARATVVDVDLLGLEDLSWITLVRRLDLHWQD